MFIKEYLDKFKYNQIKLYVDMDGVISDYDVGFACNYDKKRPLTTSIKKLEEVSKMENIEMYILSITKMNEGFEEKQKWLDINAPFFKKENRIIISRESNNFIKSSKLKADYIKKIERKDNTVIIIIDDDPRNIKEILNENEDVYLLKDTALID